MSASKLLLVLAMVCSSRRAGMCDEGQASSRVRWPDALAAVRAAVCAKVDEGHLALRMGVLEACASGLPARRGVGQRSQIGP